MARASPWLWRVAIMFMVAGATGAGASADELIFADSFESGDTSRWSTVNPPPVSRVRLTQADVVVAESVGTVTLFVELLPAAANDVEVSWSAFGGSATAGSDFVDVSGVVILNSEERSAAISVEIENDGDPESDEQFIVSLTDVVGAVPVPPTTTTITIVDDDSQHFFSFESNSYQFSEGGQQPGELTVLLDTAADSELAVRVLSSAGSAIPGVDYAPIDQILVFQAGETARTVSAEIMDDSTYEPAEGFEVTLVSQTELAGIRTASSAILEIADNDSPPTISLADGRYGASEAVGSLIVPVRLSEASGVVALVDVHTSDDDAIANEDYLPIATTLVFAPGQVERIVEIPIVGDGIPEAEEDFDIDLSNPVGCSFDLSQPRHAEVKVYDDRGLSFIVSSVAVSEDAGSVALTIEASGAVDSDIEFRWRTVAGTATAGLDYQDSAGNAEIDPPDTQTTISIPLIEDDIAELHETFVVGLYGCDDAALVVPSFVTVTILDNDPGVMFGARIFTVSEDDGAAEVEVVSNQDQHDPVTVRWTASSDTARLGDDYSPSTGTVAIPSAETSATIAIAVADDADPEGQETVNLRLSDEEGLPLGEPAEAVLTISDDDRMPVVSFSADSYSVLEIEDHMELVLVLNEPSNEPVVIQVESSDGSAVSGSDYTAVSETITIPVGQSVATVAVPLTADGLVEGDENFSVGLSVIDGAGAWPPVTASVTIVDDASLPRVSFTNAEVEVGEDDWIVTCDVVLDRVPIYEVRVRADTVGGTAVEGADFRPVHEVLTFPPGVTSLQVVVDLLDDSSWEPDETFSLVLSGASGGLVGTPSEATINIRQNDWPPFVFLAEGGHFNAEYDAYEQYQLVAVPIRLSDPSSFVAQVDVTSSGGTAMPGEDFEAVWETLVFQPGEVEKVIEIPILDDEIGDSGETIQLTLSNAVDCTLDGYLPYEGVVTIHDDIWAAFPESEVTVFEDESDVRLTITLSRAVDGGALVAYATSDGTAVAGEDYVAVDDSLFFTTGVTSLYFDVPLNQDDEKEGDETFNVTLSNLSSVPVVAPSTVEVTIFDDDVPEVAVSRAAYSVGEDGTEVVIGVELSEIATTEVSVDYATGDGTAVAGLDYTAVSDTLLIPSGQTSGHIVIPVLDDGLIEGKEHFTLALSNPQGAAVRSAGLATITIDDDELRAVIGEPDGRVYGDGDVLTMDASGSVIPPGYAVWFAVLRDDGSDPMEVVHLAAGLTDTFTTSGDHPAYRVRLVTGATEWMPNDSVLRRAALPCVSPDPPGVCASAEVVIERADLNTFPFTTSYVFPDAVLLIWGGSSTMSMELERSSDGGETWTPFPEPGNQDGDGGEEIYTSFADRTVAPGMTYHYRIKWNTQSEWFYLGNTFKSPGDPVITPVWDAPRPVPDFESVRWDCPDGASRFLCYGTLTLSLRPEPGESLAGTTISLFLNEITFEALDGRGRDVPIIWPASFPFQGRDEPGCVERKAEPDLVIEVPADQDSVTIDVPGVVYGANSFRFVVDDGQGGFSERALLYGIHDELGVHHATHDQLLPLLFGTDAAVEEFQLNGLGPVGIRSPDCADGDWRKPSIWTDEENIYTADVYWYKAAAGMVKRQVGTDEHGSWTTTLGLTDGVDHIIRMLKVYTCDAWMTGHIGRSILAADGSYVTTTETAQEVCADYSPVDVDPIHVDTSLAGPHPPVLDFAPVSLFSLSDDEVVVLPMRFRITDVHHDVDVGSVTVTNESIDPPQTAYAYYAEDQLDRDRGDWGWFVADVPTVLPDGATSFDNSFRFQAVDHAGHSLDQIINVTREKPLVWAEIADPDPPEAEPRELVTFDGAASIVPGLGAGGAVARWVIFRRPDNAPGWISYRDSGFLDGPEDLVIRVPMPDYVSMKARLIVAASMDDFPADPWSSELPCRWNEGDGRCDAKEVTVNMVDNDCYLQPTTIGIRMLSPVAPDPDPQGIVPILSFSRFDAVHLEADTTSGLPPLAYRWVLYDAEDIQLKWPLAYFGSGENGWSVDNATLDVAAADLGIAAGDYWLVVEGRYPVDGCADPAPGWFFGQSYARAVRFGHTFDGIAPGRVVEGGTFRVYSRSWIEGETGYVLLDDDLSDEVEPLVYEGVVQPGVYLEVSADPADLPAIGSRWLVSLAPSASGAGRSTWWDGLAVEPAGDATSPIQVTNEEDTSCGGVGTECAHRILPGQTMAGVWDEAGDEDYFSFLAGAGSEVRVALRSHATHVPPDHPAAPAPEIFLVGPDGVAFAVSGPPGPEGEATVEAALAVDGRHLIVARTSKGVGDYIVGLELTADGGGSAPTFGWISERVHVTTEAKPDARLRVPLLDPFSNPIAGAGVTWEEGEPCVPQGFCGTGVTVDSRSTIDGYAALDLEPAPGAPPLWKPVHLAPGSMKTLLSRPAVRFAASGAPPAEPFIGLVRASGDAVVSSELVDTALARSLVADQQQRVQDHESPATKDGPLCGGHDLSCDGDDTPVFHAVRLDLAPGEELVDLELRILRDGDPIDGLDGQTVLSDVPLAVEAIATVKPAVGGPRLELFDGPIGLAVSGESGGAVSDGSTTCDALALPAGPFVFKTGRDAVHKFTHFDENGDSCCWAPTELLTASVVLRIDVDDGQGGSIAVSKEAQAVAASSPRPADPCSLRFFETDVPHHASYVNYQAIDLGDAYLTDACGNVIVGLGRDDSPFHDQPGDEFRIVSPVGPVTGGVWATATSSSNQWSYDLFLNGDPELAQEFIPDGTYTIDFEISSLNPECAPEGISHTVNTRAGEPQVVLWWDWDWDSANSPRGWDPDDNHIPVASPLRDRSGDIAVWRVPASDDGSLDHFFSGGFKDVPVKLYVASSDSVPMDADGNLGETYLEPVEGVVLCTGVVEKLADSDGLVDWNSPVRTTCSTLWDTSTIALASSDPEYEGSSPAGPPNSWVPMGVGVGIVRGPEQPGHYVLVAEPLDPAFRRDDAWRIRSSLVPDSFKDFYVDNPPDDSENDFACDRCEDCAGGDIGLRNGNVRYTDADPVAGLPAPLTTRTYNSLNAEEGVFGVGWSSVFDARAELSVAAGKSAVTAAKSTVIDVVRVTTEDNRTYIFQAEAGADFIQWWPEGGQRNRLFAAGSGYVLELVGDPYRRTYRASDGRLTALSEIATGRVFTIDYASGVPSQVIDSWRGTVASVSVDDGLVGGVSTPMGTVSFEYGGDATLDAVNASGATWRTYGYSGDDLLTEVFDGAGYVIETYSYIEGMAASSVSAGNSITAVEWGADGPRLPIIGERVVRTDAAAGASTYYYLRWVAGKYRVVEIVGECSCSGNDRVYGYDRLGHLVFEQDGRGYISRREYLGDGRLSLTESGLRPASCDPEDFPEDPSACRLTVDELEVLAAVDVVPTDAYQVQWYAYDDPNWPNRPTQVCRPSVLQLPGESDRVACAATTYDPTTGQWTSSTESGWTGQSALEPTFEVHTSTRTFYGGAFTEPAFDPGGAFDSAWLAVSQPTNLVRSTDGPRTDVADVVQFVYYPVVEVPDAPVPVEWRGRLAAQMDPEGNITRYEDYDVWGNARRIVGPTGITTELTYDDFGRVLTRTLVGGEGCDPVDDSLCTTALVTTSAYEPGGGPIESVTSPGGSVTEYAYDDFGRMLTTDRGPAPGAMVERMANEYDPVTGLRIRDSRLGFEADVGWTEHSRTEYQHYLTGQLVLVERPRYEGDSSPSEEHYAYDVAGRIATVQDPNHTAPNVQYFYDPLGRLELVQQLLDPEAPPAEQWAETTYDYDANGSLIAVTDANGNLTEYLVDDFGQTVRIASPVTGVTEMVYDPSGNLVTRLDGRDVAATSIYDANGRLTGITYDDGVTTEILGFEYDDAGRRTRAETAEVIQTFTHSRRGLVLTASQEVAGASLNEARYEYDLDGQLETVTYPSGRTVDFDRDFAGRPTAISSVAPGAGSPVTVAEGLEYLPFGPASHLELGPPAGRLTEVREHDWHYRRTAQQLADSLPTMLLDLEYDYDPAGNLTAVTDFLGDRSAAYAYDDIGRLTGVTWADANRAFEYDPIGNLERVGVDEGLAGEGEVLLGYSANSLGNNSPVLTSTETLQGGSQLDSYTVLSDDVGNVTSDGLTALNYNLENHLEDRELKSVTLDYTYTADGRLVRSERSDTGAATEIILDIAGRRLAKLEGGVWRDYVYLGDQLLAYFDGSAVEPVQVIADHIGMPMMAVDGTGSVVWQAKAEPYGELRGEVGLSADPGLRYPGQWQDELDLEAVCVGDTCTMPGPLEDSFSLLENGYRWYKPGWGRYGQGDPLPTWGESSVFVYAAGTPTKYLDPNGLQLRMPPPAWWPAQPGCTVAGSWTDMPETRTDEYVRTRATWVPVGRGEPIWAPMGVGTSGGLKKPWRNLWNLFFRAPRQTGECWCTFKRRPGVFDVHRRSMLWKRLVNCGGCDAEYEYYEDEYEYELPGEAMYAPGEFNVKRTKGLWNETVGCIGCTEP
jgi:RHS repeat-associated protein